VKFYFTWNLAVTYDVCDCLFFVMRLLRHPTQYGLITHTLILITIYLVQAILDPECGEKYFSSHTTYKDVKQTIEPQKLFFCQAVITDGRCMCLPHGDGVCRVRKQMCLQSEHYVRLCADIQANHV